MSDSSKLAFIQNVRKGYVPPKPASSPEVASVMPSDDLDVYERRLIAVLIDRLERS
jgi:hypothetical protein